MSPTQEASALWNANAERGLPAPLCLCPCHDPVAFRADRISILVTKTPFLRGLARVNSPSQCRSRTQTYMGTVAPPPPPKTMHSIVNPPGMCPPGSSQPIIIEELSKIIPYFITEFAVRLVYLIVHGKRQSTQTNLVFPHVILRTPASE